jgi:triosephosphate isomerase
MMKPFIVANWKMNKTIGEAIDFVRSFRTALAPSADRDVVIAPPFTALAAVAEALKGSAIGLAAQNLHEEEQGAFTGEVSAAMLADVGCRFVIAGHSERRTLFGESDELINKKLKIALKFGLSPIFCVGETLEQRDAGITFDIIERQIGEGLNEISAGDLRAGVIAYEPVWAIGTGRTATPDQAEEAHRFIRAVVQMHYGLEIAKDSMIIYGGSVNPNNIGDLMSQKDVNGALVGGASLNADSFAKIANYTIDR